MTMKLSKKMSAVTALLVSIVSLSACAGGGDATGGAAEGQELVTVKVAAPPTTVAGPFYVALNEGFMEEHGINLDIQLLQGGAAALPAVLAGDLQFAASNPISLMIAADKGLPVQGVSNLAANGATGETGVAVYVAEDSPIESAADLEGKTFAVNTLNGPIDLTVRALVRDAGRDPDSVQFVELGFPDMVAAVNEGRVDAAMIPEPFKTQADAAGLRFVFDNFQDAAPGMPSTVLFTSKEWAEKNPETLNAFVAAMSETFDYISGHEEQFREILVDELKFDPQLAQTITLDTYKAEFDAEPLETLAGLVELEEWVGKPVDLNSLFGL